MQRTIKHLPLQDECSGIENLRRESRERIREHIMIYVRVFALVVGSSLIGFILGQILAFKF